MKALFSSFISVALIVSQMFSVVAYANDTPAQITPEQTLISNLFAAQATMRSQADLQNYVSAAISTYSQTASQENQLEHLEQALIQMNVMTAARVQQIVQESNSAAENLTSAGNIKSEDVQSASTAVLNQVLSTGSRGAEYSACEDRVLAGSFLVIGSAGLFAVAQVEHSGAVDGLSIVTLLTGLVLIVTPVQC